MAITFRHGRAALAATALLLVGACTQPFQARVQSFQRMPAAQGQSFTLAPMDASNQNSLEFHSYAALVSQQLAGQGFAPAAAGSKADLEVRIDYGSGPPRERLATRPGTSMSWGWYGRPYYWGRGFHPYWWGSFHDPFWDQPEVYSYTIYPAYLHVSIHRMTDKTPLFEGRAETTTRVNDLPSIMPKLAQALFQDFPGDPATSRVVKVPTEGRSR